MIHEPLAVLAQQAYVYLEASSIVYDIKARTVISRSCPISAWPMGRREHPPWPGAASPSPRPPQVYDE